VPTQKPAFSGWKNFQGEFLAGCPAAEKLIGFAGIPVLAFFPPNNLIHRILPAGQNDGSRRLAAFITGIEDNFYFGAFI